MAEQWIDLFYWVRERTCRLLTRGRHRYGPPHPDALFDDMTARVCSICGTTLLVGASTQPGPEGEQG